MKKRRPRPRARSRRRQVELPALALLGILAAVAGLGVFTWARGTVLPFLVRSATASSGVIEYTCDSDAVVMRKESVYIAGISGVARAIVRDGERVRTGMPVVEISNPSARRAVEERMSEVMEKISRFEREKGSREAFLRQEVERLEAAIKATALVIQRARFFNDAASLDEAEAELASLHEQRSAVLAEMRSIDEERRELENERDRVKTMLSRAVNLVEAGSPGVVSFSLDGCEREYHADRALSISAKAVFNAQVKPRRLTDAQEVKAGDPLFRVVQTDEVYVATSIPSSKLSEIASPQVRVRIPEAGEKALAARVARLDPGPPGGYAVLVLVIEGLPDGLLNLRTTRATVITRSVQGITVPKSALTTKDGKQGVYVIYKTLAQFRPVVVKAEGGGQAVVEGIPVGTEVILNPWLVRDGRQVR